MPTHAMGDIRSQLTGTQLQDLRDANRPPGTTRAAGIEVARASHRFGELERTLEGERLRYRITVAELPRTTSEAARAEVAKAASDVLEAVEMEIRRELAPVIARLQSLCRQVDDAANLPTTATVDAKTLRDAHTRVALLESAWADQPFETIAAHLRAALLRDDDAELIASNTVAMKLLSTRDDADSEAGDAVRRLARDAVRDFRDDMLDATAGEALTALRQAQGLDHEVLKGWQERTGNANPYFDLD